MYQKTIAPNGQAIIILEQNGEMLSFSENTESSNFQRYLEWLAAGNEPEVIEG